MVVTAGLLGGLGGYVGAALSATAPDLPTGGLIVLTLAAMFVASLVVGPARGIAAVALRRRRATLELAA